MIHTSCKFQPKTHKARAPTHYYKPNTKLLIRVLGDGYSKADNDDGVLDDELMDAGERGNLHASPK